VLLNVNRQPDANTVAVVDAVKAELAAMRWQIPKDITIALITISRCWCATQ